MGLAATVCDIYKLVLHALTDKYMNVIQIQGCIPMFAGLYQILQFIQVISIFIL